MISVYKSHFYHIKISDTCTFCLPDVHEIDMEQLGKNLKSKADYFRLGCLHINMWGKNCIRAFFPGCQMKNGTYLVSDVEPLCRNSYNLPISCSKEDVHAALTYFYQIYQNTETK